MSVKFICQSRILLSSSPYVSFSLQHCVSLCTYIAWFGMAITKYVMYVCISTQHGKVTDTSSEN